MWLRKIIAWTDEEFLDDSLRCCREAIERGDRSNAEFWANHVFSFARLLYKDWMWEHGARIIEGDTFLARL